MGNKPLKNDFENFAKIDSGENGGNFPEIHRAIMMFKSWLHGIYHRVNDLQAYINEYISFQQAFDANIYF